MAKDSGSAKRGTESGSLQPNLSGNRIGVARVRGFELNSGTGSTNLLTDAEDSDAIFNAYLFDIKMFTELVLSDTPNTGITTGDKLTGVSSGATGFVESAGSGDDLVLDGTDSSSNNSGEKLLLELGTLHLQDALLLEDSTGVFQLLM